MKNITITGARIHNLKGINVSLPKNKLIVATGVSGSGKSSLVFDIIFAEGRKQYLQSLGMLSGIGDEKMFDSITGISPAIAVQQSIIRQSNPRSTVGSKTALLSLLGVLYAGDGRLSCVDCESPVGKNLLCTKCGREAERLEANYFSYNAPNGMCMKCSGRGAYFEIDMKKLVPEKSMTLRQVFDRVEATPGYANLLNRTFKDHLKTPFARIPAEVKEEILYGRHVNGNYAKRSACLTRIFEGGLHKQNEETEGLYGISPCSECHGLRVGAEARRVHLKDKNIGELGQMTLVELQDFLNNLLKQKSLSSFGKNLIKEILRKNNNLLKARLGHLSLYREMPTLSGGEIQRLFLNSHLDSKMDSLIYILDEPTVGLHESEKAELLKSIQALKDQGNTVIVVEHDRNTIEMAEHIIDIGPKAGVEGGQVIFQGSPAGLLKSKKSITGRYLSGKIPMPERTGAPGLFDKSGPAKSSPNLTIRNAGTNNLKDVTVSFPLGVLVGIAGVSGSGKSSLISDTLIPLLKSHFQEQRENARQATEINDSDAEPGDDSESALFEIKTIADKLEGTQHLTGYAEVSQAPIGRNMNSNPASYIGIWDKIRKLFAGQPEAKRRKLAAGHFSFNSKGACSKCGGSGREKIWLGGEFFIYNTCEECNGQRYNDEALSILYKEKNIVDVLAMSVSQALEFFEDTPGITRTLEVMERIGMGYIGLGQPTPGLSGGEAQRVKLAKEIGRRRKGNILYVLDEPTTGLSLYDTARLIELLDELVAAGNSVIVIEHDPVVLSSCDWLIELGPEGGAAGGKVIAQGSPRTLKKNKKSVTGKYL